MAAAVIGSVWGDPAEISTREVVVGVIQKDVPFDNHVPQEEAVRQLCPAQQAVPCASPDPQAGRRRPAEHGAAIALLRPERRKRTSSSTSRSCKDAAYRRRRPRPSKIARPPDADGNRFNAVGVGTTPLKAVPDPSVRHQQRPVRRRSVPCVVSNKDQNSGPAPPCTTARKVVIRHKPRRAPALAQRPSHQAAPRPRRRTWSMSASMSASTG